MKSYSEALKAAQTLKQDASTPIYQDLNGEQIKIHNYIVLTCNDPTPYDVFKACTRFSRLNGMNGFFYSKLVPVRASNGNMLPKSEWKKVVMFHKKWARKDIELSSVTFDIVGLKRKSTHLSAGVLINNVTFM